MSTKAILEMCRQLIQFGTPEQQTLARPALAEVEAIKRAAETATRDMSWTLANPTHSEAAFAAHDLFKAIARQND